MPRRNDNAGAARNEGGGIVLAPLERELGMQWQRWRADARERREQARTEQKIQQIRTTYGSR